MEADVAVEAAINNCPLSGPIFGRGNATDYNGDDGPRNTIVYTRQ